MFNLKDLVKSDRRKEWQSLKSKHGKELKAKKVDFESKFGAGLDRYDAAIGPMRKLFERGEDSKAAAEKVCAAARPLRNVAEAYRAKVKGLGGTLERDMTRYLREVELECDDWEKALDVVSNQSLVGRNKPVQVKAVHEVYGTLDALGQQLINLVRSLGDLQTRAKKVPSAAKYRLYQEQAGAKARPEKDWLRELNADMGMLASSAAVLHGLTRTADTAVKRLLVAVVKFDERSDYGAVKDLATALANGSTLKDFRERAWLLKNWIRSVLETRADYAGMKIAGADVAELRRVVISAHEASVKLVDPLIASIRKMP